MPTLHRHLLLSHTVFSIERGDFIIINVSNENTDLTMNLYCKYTKINIFDGAYASEQRK